MRDDRLSPTFSHAIDRAPSTATGCLMGHDRIEYRAGLAPWQEHRAKALLRSNLDGYMTIAQIAVACRLSRGHFTRAFRNSTGLAPIRWRNALRVDIAKTLLGTPEVTLLDVAFECGFTDQAHLSRVFRELTGSSPGKWRREAYPTDSTASAGGVFAIQPANQVF